MYDWLTPALSSPDATVVTGNQRLARTLREHYDATQAASGKAAWQRPALYPESVFIGKLYAARGPEQDGALRLNQAQSVQLWEHCLVDLIDDPFVDLPALATSCYRHAKRLAQWCVPADEIAASASGADQRLFVRASEMYASRLQELNALDDNGLAAAVLAGLRDGRIRADGAVTLAGFDRITPLFKNILEAWEDAGGSWQLKTANGKAAARTQAFESTDSEYRAAGAWARQQLQNHPGRRVAVIVAGLEKNARVIAHRVREGFSPGWQTDATLQAALDVSFGQRLSQYPAIRDALAMLRFIATGLLAPDVGGLLRSPYFLDGPGFARNKLELRFREWPQQRWTARQFADFASSELRPEADASLWIDSLQTDAVGAVAATHKASPTHWAATFEACLRGLGWPGSQPLSSHDFQLVNRFFDTLNEFSRLATIVAQLTAGEAIARIGRLASDTVFQPEGNPLAVPLLGPLEAAGLELDAVWCCGMSSDNWPPAGNPLPLVNRDLQRRYQMPDATPADTTDYAQRQVERIRASATDVIFSWPKFIGDAEQQPSVLIADFAATEDVIDPGWYASTLRGRVDLSIAPDQVPPVRSGEKIAGGAAVFDWQQSEPFFAFARGRLQVPYIPQWQPGIGPQLRGNLLHDALASLYRDLPTQADICNWLENDAAARIDGALRRTYRWRLQYFDSVHSQLLLREIERSKGLLGRVLQVDKERSSFAVAAVEDAMSTKIGALHLRLRCDRVDRVDGGIGIIDYKTGARKVLKGRKGLNSLQLVVYATALAAETTCGMALFNIDTRDVSISGVGTPFGDEKTSSNEFAEWHQLIVDLAAEIAAGDVRIQLASSKDARVLGLLSRYAEVLRDGT